MESHKPNLDIITGPLWSPPASAAISKRGYTLLKSSLAPDQLRKIRDDLTFQPLSYDGKPEGDPYTMFRENDAKLYLPRAYANAMFGPAPKNSETDGIPINPSIQFAGKMRPHQEEVIAAVKKRFETPTKGGIIEIYCGGGKTTIILYIIGAIVRQKTLIVVHKEFLLEQWCERIRQFLPGVKIGTIQGSTIDVEGKDIVIGMLQSLSKKEYDPALFDQFGCAVVDECHCIGSRVFSQALLKINTKYFIGLSATPDRKDRTSNTFYYAMGPTIIRLKRDGFSGLLVQTVNIVADPDNKHFKDELMFDGSLNKARMVTNISLSPSRLAVLIKMLEVLYAENRKILILSERREHLDNIAAALASLGISHGFYVGRNGMNKKVHKNVLKESESKSIILATYQMAKEGLDIPGLNTLIMATPRSDIEQAVGRILRDTERALAEGILLLVVDMVDHCGSFPNQYTRRKAFYRENDYPISKMTLHIDAPDENWVETFKKREYIPKAESGKKGGKKAASVGGKPGTSSSSSSLMNWINGNGDREAESSSTANGKKLAVVNKETLAQKLVGNKDVIIQDFIFDDDNE